MNALLHPPRVAAAKLSVTVEQLMGFVRDGELRYVNIGRGKKRDGRTKGDHYPLTLSGVKTRWRRTRADAGVSDFRFHDFRHDFATKLLRELATSSW